MHTPHKTSGDAQRRNAAWHALRVCWWWSTVPFVSKSSSSSHTISWLSWTRCSADQRLLLELLHATNTMNARTALTQNETPSTRRDFSSGISRRTVAANAYRV